MWTVLLSPFCLGKGGGEEREIYGVGGEGYFTSTLVDAATRCRPNSFSIDTGEGVVKLQPLALPEGMTPSSSEIIASLNEHLVQTLQAR